MNKFFLLMAIVLPLVFISCKDDKGEPEIPDNHEWVDLGLPSGTLWATCNIGADSPEDYGDYFAWGETTPKDVYDWNNYKWCDWSRDTSGDIPVESITWYKYYSKNWTDNAYVDGDNKLELEPEDDAAYVNWGPRWRMPTLEQIDELVEKCDWQWTQRKGVNGRLVTGPNGNSIFLPAAGGRSEKLYWGGQTAYYWSRTLCSPSKLTIEAAGQRHAYILIHDSWGNEIWYDSRCEGKTVRAVRASRK